MRCPLGLLNVIDRRKGCQCEDKRSEKIARFEISIEKMENFDKSLDGFLTNVWILVSPPREGARENGG